MNITAILITLIICITVLILVSILNKSDNEPTLLGTFALKRNNLPIKLKRYDNVFIEYYSNDTFKLVYFNDFDDDKY